MLKRRMALLMSFMVLVCNVQLPVKTEAAVEMQVIEEAVPAEDVLTEAVEVETEEVVEAASTIKLKENASVTVNLGKGTYSLEFTPRNTGVYYIYGQGELDDLINCCELSCNINKSWYELGDLTYEAAALYLYAGETYRFRLVDDEEPDERIGVAVKYVGKDPVLKSGPYKTTYIKETEKTLSGAGVILDYSGMNAEFDESKWQWSVEYRGEYDVDAKGNKKFASGSQNIIVYYGIVDGKTGDVTREMPAGTIQVVSAKENSSPVEGGSPVEGRVTGNTDCYQFTTGSDGNWDYNIYGDVNAKLKIYNSKFRLVYDAGEDAIYDAETDQYMYPQKESVSLEPDTDYYVMLVADQNCIGGSYFLTLSQTGSKHEHIWSDWKVISKASCTARGKEVRECLFGDLSETRTFAALGHKAGSYTVVKEPTYFKAGLQVRKCTRCGMKLDEKKIPKLKLNKPTGFKVKKATRKAVTLKWKKDASVTGYKLYRSEKKKGGYKLVKTLKNKASYTDKKVKGRKTYYYQLKAYVKSGKKVKTSKGATARVKTAK